jgi:uncharacterized protein YgiM (DUF1202 family)
MKKMFICFLLILSAVSSWSQLVVTTAKVNLRTAPDDSSICVIPKGTTLNVIEASEGWSKVTYGKKEGYVSNTFIQPYNNKTLSDSTNIHYYKNSKGVKVQSPTHYNKAPEGATAQCNDGTYSFSQSRRGTCSHHGGVKKWLK